jgi:hypothetical protein
MIDMFIMPFIVANSF